jgi:hypothetical protein
MDPPAPPEQPAYRGSWMASNVSQRHVAADPYKFMPPQQEVRVSLPKVVR